MLNNQHAFDQAQHFAARLVREVGHDRTAQLERAWQLALARPATDEETREAIDLLRELEANHQDMTPIDEEAPAELAKLPVAHAAALTRFCLVLFNLNEFIYVD